LPPTAFSTQLPRSVCTTLPAGWTFSGCVADGCADELDGGRIFISTAEDVGGFALLSRDAAAGEHLRGCGARFAPSADRTPFTLSTPGFGWGRTPPVFSFHCGARSVYGAAAAPRRRSATLFPAQPIAWPSLCFSSVRAAACLSSHATPLFNFFLSSNDSLSRACFVGIRAYALLACCPACRI
jgi:hypothetical protein